VDLRRQREAAERIDELARIGDDNHPVGGGGDDLFAQQGAAAALDEVHAGVDLVGAVDGEVEAVEGVEVGKGNAEGAGLPVGGLGGGDAEDLEAVADALAEQVDEVAGGGAGAEAETHAGADVAQRHGGGLTLHFLAHAA